MRLSDQKLAQHLKGKLASIYLFAGDEILLVEEAGDLVRAAARRAGYTDREVFNVMRGFDWNLLTQFEANLSLFAAKRLIEIRLPTGKPGTDGAKTLINLANRALTDTIILIFCPRLDTATQKSAWLTNLERAGVLVTISNIETAKLPNWITERMQARGLKPNTEAVKLLAELVEGNLLAGAQEIDKLQLLIGNERTIDANMIATTVADSARFDIYSLADACLIGDSKRAIHVLTELRAEGIELPIILWVLTKELRILASITGEINSERALSGVWERRRPLIINAFRRLGIAQCENLLRQAAQIDRYIKGSLIGNSWGEIFNLVLNFCK